MFVKLLHQYIIGGKIEFTRSFFFFFSCYIGLNNGNSRFHTIMECLVSQHARVNFPNILPLLDKLDIMWWLGNNLFMNSIFRRHFFNQCTSTPQGFEKDIQHLFAKFVPTQVSLYPFCSPHRHFTIFFGVFVNIQNSA